MNLQHTTLSLSSYRFGAAAAAVARPATATHTRTVQVSRVPLPANVSVGHWAPYVTDVLSLRSSSISLSLSLFFLSRTDHSCERIRVSQSSDVIRLEEERTIFGAKTGECLNIETVAFGFGCYGDVISQTPFRRIVRDDVLRIPAASFRCEDSFYTFCSPHVSVFIFRVFPDRLASPERRSLFSWNWIERLVRKKKKKKMRNTSLLAAPAEPVIENDLPLDLSCNSRRRSEADDEEEVGECPSRREIDVVGDGNGRVLSIGGPPSPPRSPADFRALSDLGYVAYHRQLMAMERQRQWLERKQQQEQEDEEEEENRSRRHRHRRHQRTPNEDDMDVDDDDLLIMRRSGSGSPPGSGHEESDDSDDSSHQPMDLGANPKAYKKSLMKRYRKSLSLKKLGHISSIRDWFPQKVLSVFFFFYCRFYRVDISPRFGRDPPGSVWKVKSPLPPSPASRRI